MTTTAADVERAGFLRAICQNPFEDTHRLAFADWLEENGDDGRADFIRICVRDKHVENGCTLQPHVHLDRCWWVKYGIGFVPFVTGFKPEQYLYRRGFVDELRLPAASFTERVARELFAAHPVTRVVLTDREPDHDTDDTRGWYCGPFDGPLPHWWDIPVHLWIRLKRGIRPGWYATRAEAIDALSDAAVGWGRELAGLAPLPAKGGRP